METSASEAGALPGPLPSGDGLLALERQGRRDGTGLGPADLLGCWQLDQVWPKGRRRPDSLSGLLLRGLGARLEIRSGGEAAAAGAAAATAAGAAAALAAAADAPPLQLRNAVTLGPLELRFEGPGWLQGRRPLLLFRFERLELRWGGRLLLSRALPSPPPQRLPFFALIRRDPAGWLAARGRGGGLALWRLALQP